MRDGTVVKKLVGTNPTTVYDVLRTGLGLRFIGGGAFRDAYEIIDSNLVIKIPRMVARKKDYLKNIQHAKDEFHIYRRMKSSRKKYKAFKKYLPCLVYFNMKSGIILMRKYSEPKHTKATVQLIEELDADLIKVFRTETADIHYGNLGTDKDGSIKIIDMGLFITGKV